MRDVPKSSVDILVVRDGKLLLGPLTEKWSRNGERVYGVPGRDIEFRETIGDAVARYVREELGCAVRKYEVISVNANYEHGDHYIGVGVVARIEGEPRVTMPDDWVAWEWYGAGELPEKIFGPARNLIDCYLEGKVCVAE